MLQNSRVTVFTIFELLKENQQGGEWNYLPINTQIRVNESEKYDFIYNRIRYLISVKSDITYAISHNYAKIKVDSFDSLLLEKTMTFHNDIILIKSAFNKDKNN